MTSQGKVRDFGYPTWLPKGLASINRCDEMNGIPTAEYHSDAVSQHGSLRLAELGPSAAGQRHGTQ